MFYDDATMLESTKKHHRCISTLCLVHLLLFHGHQAAILFPCFSVCKHCRKLFLKMTLDQAYNYNNPMLDIHVQIMNLFLFNRK